jgi:hypothetical protein
MAGIATFFQLFQADLGIAVSKEAANVILGKLSPFNDYRLTLYSVFRRELLHRQSVSLGT